MSPQAQSVYRWLQDGGSITDMEALRMFGIRRLAARIHEIREVAEVRAVTEKANGKRWARYELVRPVDPQGSLFLADDVASARRVPHAGTSDPYETEDGR